MSTVSSTSSLVYIRLIDKFISREFPICCLVVGDANSLQNFVSSFQSDNVNYFIAHNVFIVTELSNIHAFPAVQGSSHCQKLLYCDVVNSVIISLSSNNSSNKRKGGCDRYRSEIQISYSLPIYISSQVIHSPAVFNNMNELSVRQALNMPIQREPIQLIGVIIFKDFVLSDFTSTSNSSQIKQQISIILRDQNYSDIITVYLPFSSASHLLVASTVVLNDCIILIYAGSYKYGKVSSFNHNTIG